MTSTMLARVIQVIEQHRYRWANESDLQRSIHRVLADNGVECTREYVLTEGNRVDVWVPHGNIAVEIKCKGGVSPLARQIKRYAATGIPRELLVVTTRAVHQGIPRFAPGPSADAPVPVRVLFLPTAAA